MPLTTRRVSLYEYQQCTPEDEPALRGVSLEDPATRALVGELARTGKLIIEERRHGLSIRATSFVGRVTVGSLEVTIQPKIRGMPLVSLLRYAFGLRQLTLGDSVVLATGDRAFQELLALQLAAEAEELLGRGLHRTYRARSEALTVPRGRIDMQRLAGHASTSTLTLPCVWHPRTEDCLVNQILFQGLRLAAQISDDIALRSRLRRLAAQLDDTITPITLDWQALRRHWREANRLVATYEPAITLIGLLLEAQGATFESGQADVRLPGALFNMEKLFEVLLGRFLQENLEHYSVQEQHRLRGLFAYEADYNPQRRTPPTPRPDYVVMQGSRAVAFLDAKYRDLWEHELPRDMLYQLAMYALSGGAGDQATILYPTLDGLAREARIQISHPMRGTPIGGVVIRPVHLGRLANLLDQPEAVAIQRERAAFAHTMAFGS
jgi:5-methylcytosine-specific restriction enzyme subunit McrC